MGNPETLRVDIQQQINLETEGSQRNGKIIILKESDRTSSWFIFDGFLLTLKLELLGDREVGYKLQ